MTNLQVDVDALAYPPTHTFKVDGLRPTGSLKERVALIEREFSDFFSRGRLLDVGCNKGFFARYHDGPIVGCDVDERFVDLCRRLRPDGEFRHCGFDELPSDLGQFDRVFIGNGPHHLYASSGGWGWVDRLAQLSCGQVLMEGLVDMAHRDALGCIPPSIAGEFTREARDRALGRHFWGIKEVPSPLASRYFTLLLRKTIDEPYAEYLVHLYATMRQFVDRNDVVKEVCVRQRDRGAISRQMLPHREYIMVDRDCRRPGLCLDAAVDVLPESDVTLSTAILHHTSPSDIPRLFENMARSTKRTMLLSGPNVEMYPIYGDHLYHIDEGHMRKVADAAGWRTVHVQRMGRRGDGPAGEFELLMVFER